MRLARLFPDLSFRDVVLMETQAYNDLQVSNPARYALLRVLVTDPLPTITNLQRIVAGPVVIEALQARETWTVIDKTPQEIADEAEAAAIAADLLQVQNRLDNLVEAINQHQAVLDVPYSEPPQAGTNALEITALRLRTRNAEQAIRGVERDLILAMRSARFLLRETKHRLSAAATLVAARGTPKTAKK
jgi:hypothetical protein